MATEISIVNSQKKVKLDIEMLKKIAAKALSNLNEDDGLLSVCIVDDIEIKRLNYKYRRVNSPTDVLAFSMRQGTPLKGEQGILGDVVISAQAAVRAARRFDRKVGDEMNLYLVHGILHLAGYDDSRPAERKKMERLQDCILALLRG